MVSDLPFYAQLLLNMIDPEISWYPSDDDEDTATSAPSNPTDDNTCSLPTADQPLSADPTPTSPATPGAPTPFADGAMGPEGQPDGGAQGEGGEAVDGQSDGEGTGGEAVDGQSEGEGQGHRRKRDVVKGAAGHAAGTAGHLASKAGHAGVAVGHTAKQHVRLSVC